VGMEHQQAGRLDEAAAVYEAVLTQHHDHPDALHLLGLARRQQGDYPAAVRLISRAIELVPGQPVLHNNLGDALRQAGKLEDATTNFRMALELNPDYAGAHLNLTLVHIDLGNFTAALEHARAAVRLSPDLPKAWYHLGWVLQEHMDQDGALEAFETAIRLDPGHLPATTHYLFTLLNQATADPALVARAHMERAAALFGSETAPTSQAPLAGKIQIGYISGDFRAHAVNYFFEPILEHHDSDRFEIFCYSDVKKPDAVTARLERMAGHWRDIEQLPDAAVFDLVRQDRIQVLVDLAGITEFNRLGVFARRAAPCQVSFLGYPATTGLASMDYRVVDGVTCAEDEELPGSEAPLRIKPLFAPFKPPVHAPEVAPPPSLENGFITFGSFHKLDKLNASVIETWAGILRRMPGAQLMLARDNLDDWHQQRLLKQFGQWGVAPEQLRFHHYDPAASSFLELYREVDIQLDPFPWSGHTIACMSLWMGVPVVTLHGDAHAGRMVSSVMQATGLGEWVAKSRAEYLEIASRSGSDFAQLADLRKGMRSRLETSPLVDGPGFVQAFEKQIRRIV